MNDGNFLLSVIKKFDLEDGTWKEIYSNLEEEVLFSSYQPKGISKEYLFLWSNQEPEEQLEQADRFIETYLEHAVIPQDTYLILFSRVPDLSTESYKKIIKVEENEFCYKKYVCYYTENELKDLRSKSEEIFNIDGNFFKSYPEYKKDISFTLLYRMIIKIPLINMGFEKKELDDFHNTYTSVRKQTDSFSLKEITEMEDIILPSIKKDGEIEKNIIDLVNDIIKDVYGGDIDEYLS